MRHLSIVLLMSLLLVPGCGGGGGSDPAEREIPAAAAALETQVKTGMVRFVPMVSNVETGLVFLLNPAAGLAPGVSVLPDTRPGALPHAVVISGTYDGNGDGIDETTLSGSAAFRSDPAVAWTGLDGRLTVDVAIPVVGHVYHGDIAFTITSDQRQLSGAGTFTHPLNGTTTTMSVPAAAPLVVKPATGQAGGASNACGYSLQGQVQLEVSGSAGTLRSQWNFSPERTAVGVTGATFTDPAGQATPLPDSSVDLRCGGSGALSDWAASFDQRWACLPLEAGNARLTIAVAGADSISISDEDPPGSGDLNTYQAAIVGASPHAVRGFFVAGAPGNRYREDFNWTLGKNGSGFTQVSTYRYTEGPATGQSGICVASARRLP